MDGRGLDCTRGLCGVGGGRAGGWRTCSASELPTAMNGEVAFEASTVRYRTLTCVGESLLLYRPAKQ